MFSRRQYPLPDYPPNAASTFHNLCRTLSAAEVGELREILAFRMKEMRQRRATGKSLLNIELAEKLNTCSEMLLERYDKESGQNQKLIVGAISYFVLDHDSLSDESYASGLHDDAQVMNHVLEELEIQDQFIQA